MVALETLITTLQKCRQSRNLPLAQRIYSYMQRHGLDTDGVLGNYLVPMLADCGSLADAQAAFDRLSFQNEHSWCSLLVAYVEYGEQQHAFQLYQKMCQKLVRPSNYTFLPILRACARLKDKETGRLIHAEIVETGLEKDHFIRNTLLDMYGKCGLLADACDVFDELSVRDAVSWTGLIAGYAEQGFGDKAISCLEQMQQEGLSLDPVVAVWSLKACGSIRITSRGQLLCTDIAKRGLDADLFVANSMVDMYAKCGALVDAKGAFDQLAIQDIVSWTALIGGYAENGLRDKAFKCFEQMKLEGVSPNTNSYVCILAACNSPEASERGQLLHSEITNRGLEREPYVGNTLLDMYSKCRLMTEAQDTFDRLPFRDAVSWGALISGYSEHALDEEVLNCFEEMQLEGVYPDTITFVQCLKSCGTVGALETGRKIHDQLRKMGLGGDLFVGNTLLGMYGKCGCIEQVREVFEKLPLRDVVSWNAMIKAYGENYEGNMAIKCFEDMQKEDVKPDVVTFTCLLVACSHANMVTKGQEYFRIMREVHGIEPTVDHCTCMVDLLARSGYVYEAEKFVEAMHCPPSVTALLTGCKNYGKVEVGLRCFEQLVQGIPEDAAAYLLMTDIYASAGRWGDANKITQLKELVQAKKKSATALIEIDKKLHVFIVGSHNQDVARLEKLSSCLKDVGYVPNLDLLSEMMCM